MRKVRALVDMRTVAAFVRVVGIVFGLVAASHGWAETYPSRPITVVVPYPAGGGVDIITRYVANELGTKLNQTVIVKNEPGGSGIIGTRDVARAAPDGYTILATDLGPLVTLPHLDKTLGYDPLTDFAPISLLSQLPEDFLVTAALPVKSFQEFLTLAKSKPKSELMTYATLGKGSFIQLSMERLKRAAGMDLIPVPYNGAPAAARGVATGEVQAILIGINSMLPFVQNGQIRALATGGTTREAVLPDVPTFDEAGVKGFTSYAWFALLMPAGTDKNIITRLSKEVQQILATADIKEKFAKIGMEAVGSSSEQLTTYIKEEYATWGKVVKDADVHLE